MKSLTLRASVALACALSLAGCGGGNKNLLLSGSITGLSQAGLVLQNNGEKLVIAANQTTFSFPTLLSNDEAFDVTVASAPASADCTVTNGKGKTGAYNVTSVLVKCVTHTFELSGKIDGLGDASGMVIVNGSDRQEIPAGANSFTMTRFNADGSYASGKVAQGAPYGVSILTQPAGRSCTVQNGSGTMGDKTYVSNVQIVCNA
ncbi:MAG: hypothetical protein H7335_19450 [Massilia sp.]|nr:hypothetical protein [Massilia sp.]